MMEPTRGHPPEFATGHLFQVLHSLQQQPLWHFSGWKQEIAVSRGIQDSRRREQHWQSLSQPLRALLLKILAA